LAYTTVAGTSVIRTKTILPIVVSGLTLYIFNKDRFCKVRYCVLVTTGTSARGQRPLLGEASLFPLKYIIHQNPLFVNYKSHNLTRKAQNKRGRLRFTGTSPIHKLKTIDYSLPTNHVEASLSPIYAQGRERRSRPVGKPRTPKRGLPNRQSATCPQRSPRIENLGPLSSQ
jgi:hypothetical protein